MKREKLIAAGEAAFGKRWQTDMAAALSVSDRTIRNWVSGKYQIPDLVSADITVMLKNRKKNIDEALTMIKETYLMNPATGSVDTEENWLAEMPEWEVNASGETPEQQFGSLIEVEKDSAGEWVVVE
ncbi:DUF1870 family protein [Entomohabitans teleogrylli]|uniref:Aca2/YdiL-like domain-containing protein n=1 Tax=Entomohabitans teleogrylli TaxID=1384589 RepID=UPI00073D8DC0|nr:DUF1870 family protein [Entomohabitans teleogrylli]